MLAEQIFDIVYTGIERRVGGKINTQVELAGRVAQFGQA